VLWHQSESTRLRASPREDGQHDSLACNYFVADGQICDFLEESFELFQAIIRAHL
jgi:hypothetical protein